MRYTGREKMQLGTLTHSIRTRPMGRKGAEGENTGNGERAEV